MTASPGLEMGLGEGKETELVPFGRESEATLANSEKSFEGDKEFGSRDLAQEQKSLEHHAGDGSMGENSMDGRKEADVPPDGGYGWVCVTCCAIINAHTWGVNSSYAVFLAYYLAHSVFPGATPLGYALIGGLSFSQALIVSPVATLTTRLYGTRVTLLIGIFFETLSFIGASFATKMWHLFLTQGICFGWGIGFLFVGSVAITSQWFSARRSLANGISAAGSGLGGLVYSLAAQAMIRNIGLAWAFRILGLIACVVNLVCAMLVKDRNKQIGSSQLSFDYRLFRKPEFLGLLVFGFLSMLGYVVLLFSLPNYAKTIGLTASQGSIIGAVLNLGQALGRPPIGYFSDSFGRINMATTATFLAGFFSLVIWSFAKSFGVLIFFAIVGGMFAGTFWAVMAPVWSEVMGIVDLPSSLSITCLVLVVPTTFSEAIALEIVAFNHNSYTGAILFTGFMYIGAAGFVLLVRAWKIGDLEMKAAVLEKESVQNNSAGVISAGNEQQVDSAAAPTPVQEPFRRSPFVKRMFVWKKV